MARHSIRTPELEDAVLVRLEAGETLSAICRDEDMPARSGFLRWCEEDSTLMDKYTRARKMGWDAIAEDAVRISDDSSDDPNSRRVRIDTRKWLLGKLYPHVYGDRVETQLTGSAQINVVVMPSGAAAPELADGDTIDIERSIEPCHFTALPKPAGS